MNASDELFQLIKSLTPSEKRYFKVYASKHVIGKSNHYEKLFDAMDALPDDKDYDEAAFKRSLRGKSYGKNLSDEKSHLREILLKSMRMYHAERTSKGRLVEMIHEISFLYSKGFVRQCHQQIERAMDYAEANEQHEEMLVLNDFLMKLYRENQAAMPFSVRDMEQREKALLNKIAVTREAVFLRMKITDIDAKRQWKERAEEARFYMHRAEELASTDRLSMRASMVLLNSRQTFLIRHGHYQQSLDISEAWLERNSSLPLLPDTMADSFKLVMANYMMCAMHCERFDLLPDGISRLKQCRSSFEKEEADTFRLSTQYELIYLLNTGQFEGAAKVLHDIETGLKKYHRFIPADQMVTFRFNMALCYFLRKQYSECTDQLHALHALSGREKRYEYTTAMGRTMEWMCQSSLGQHEILDSSLRSLKRYFAERNMEHEFFDHMFHLFGAVIAAGNRRTPQVRNMHEQIKKDAPTDQWGQLQAIVATWLYSLY
jgi:hypothetical protein